MNTADTVNNLHDSTLMAMNIINIANILNYDYIQMTMNTALVNCIQNYPYMAINAMDTINSTQFYPHDYKKHVDISVKSINISKYTRGSFPLNPQFRMYSRLHAFCTSNLDKYSKLKNCIHDENYSV